ncbi:Thiaminase-2 [Pseudovibrio axinellae]|uniref:Aminopyrimidine aminohydrolase n=1 Tax=Pseudovibrio axinellae TaxID=989403 RepID=A0A165XCX5_9HYPH|nr:thiaminase II [Pseudovibrio axinellae]KZL17583.1 Thiaminase-2 [Pseudovibrio axinellae]SER31985.1 thiaminase (transcriptional activator TenA) [Pseudovibrio axinellae]
MSLFNSLKNDNLETWHSYTKHEFVQGLGNGKLHIASFKKYLVQDYLFLIEFARAYALGMYKATDLVQMRKCLSSAKGILETEMGLHIRLCESWGLSEDEIVATPEEPANLAYTRYVLDTAMKGDMLDLKIALAPCAIGYGEIGAALAKQEGALDESNPYAEWIREYSSDEYQDLAADAVREIDELGSLYSTEARYTKLSRIFREATRLEANFWQMGLEV